MTSTKLARHLLELPNISNLYTQVVSWTDVSDLDK